MTRAASIKIAIAAIVAANSGFAQDPATQESSDQRIAVWGSSVANGSGDESQAGGYAGHLKTLLLDRDWQVLNQSRGGDNTVTITSRFEPGENPHPGTKYLTNVDPDYVIIGLSLGNEGIAQCQLGQTDGCTDSLPDAEAVFVQFASGLERLIARAQTAGITPVVALPYARSDFWEREYRLTRRMNLLINSWNVPSINTLGAVDDGHGRWARGLWSDPYHPNAAGHAEIAYSFVPSLFDALQQGKATPKRLDAVGYAHLVSDNTDAISYDVDATLHSFALTFKVRPAKDGTIAGIQGRLLDSQYSIERRSYGAFEWDTESLELTPANEFAAAISLSGGSISYTSSDGDSVSTTPANFNEWHYLTLTHYTGRGETLLYVDGELVGSVTERLQPGSFLLGGTANTGYQDLMIHRAGLTGDEIRALHSDKLLQASLEIYVPLRGVEPAANYAQSLSEIRVGNAAVNFRTD